MCYAEGMSATYKNPWWKPDNRGFGPPFYTAYPGDVGKPYRGFLIFHRGACYDVVKDGVCVTQMAGPSGAKRAIDSILAQNVDDAVIKDHEVTCSLSRAA